MSANLRRLIVLLVGVLLVVAPLFTRLLTNRLNKRTYQPPAMELADLAVTPIPTPTAMPLPPDVTAPADELSQGPVWVDFAHFPWLDPSQFESLATALAARGTGLRLWVSSVDLSAIDGPESFPDQSEELAALLQDASGLVVVSPFVLWTPAEVARVEKFIADGGRLLLISDPDVLWDAPWNINSLGERFGVVFNDDYLFDLSQNDSNYTHFFQGEFLDQAAALRGNTVVFYGARSIGGSVVTQARSADTTLSSLRSGFTHFTTVAIGGQETNGTAGNVLAMGDFDVLTEPYVARHDNRVVLEFVADFLTGGQRVQTLPDFPGYLGKQVALIFGGDVSVDAELLQQGSRLQQRLDETGRVLTLSSSTSLASAMQVTETVALTEAITVTATPSPTAATGDAGLYDWIYLGTFRSADEETSLLANAGIRLVEEIQTPEATEPALGATDESTAEGGDERSLLTATPTPLPKTIPEPGAEAVSPEGTELAASQPPVTDTLKPTGTLLLETDFGLRLLAAETVLILQWEGGDGSRVIAVLGDDSQAISAGLNRLLSHYFSDCVNEAKLSICPFFTEGGPADTGATAPDTSATQPGEAPAPSPGGGEAPGPDVTILIVDDNDQAASDETSEAVIYLQTLTEMGYAPDLRSTTKDGSPGQADLTGYNWVIWSGGAYETSGPEIDELDILRAFISGGGGLTISGRNHPLTGDSPKEASVIADVVKTDEVPALVVGFPDEPIELPAGLPPVVPIQVEADNNGANWLVTLRRGPNSADSDAPLMVAFTDAGEPDAVGIRMSVVGIPLNWLPDGYAAQLVQNMASWMLAMTGRPQ